MGTLSPRSRNRRPSLRGLARALCAPLVLLATLPPAAAPACQLGLEGENFDLSSETVTQRLAPAVSYNVVVDEFMAVWFDTRNPGNNDIFGQRVAGDGTLLGTNFPVIEFAEAQVDPWIAHNPIDNEYLVAWKTQQPGYFNRGRARRIAADGSQIGNDFLIGNGHEISIAHNAIENQFLVTARSPDIRGRRVSNVGTLVGPEILITNIGAPAPNGHVAYDGNNNQYLATWRDQVSENLQGRLIAADGTLLGGPILISAVFPSSGTAASLAFDPENDRHLVVFGVFQETEIYGQFVASDGSLIGSNFPIEDGLSGSVNPFVVHNPAADCFVVLWKNANTILAQALTLDGDLTGEPLTVSSGTVSGEPTAAVDPVSGNILAVWTDSRNAGEGEPDIYGQLITCTDPAGVSAPPVEAAVRLQIAPNPISEGASISFRMPSSGGAVVEIFDPAGRRIRNLPAGTLGPGAHSIAWDGRDATGRAVPEGVYFVRLRVDGGRPAGHKLWVLR